MSKYCKFREFLESVPPGQNCYVTDLIEPEITDLRDTSSRRKLPKLNSTEIQLHCHDDDCNGIRFFSKREGSDRLHTNESNLYLTYGCNNCNDFFKTYAISVKIEQNDSKSGHAFKYGENPPFGDPTPARAIKLIGPDKDIFLKGRRAENIGLGIGAFVYYRRVIENQKNRILDEVIRVLKKTSSDTYLLKELETAKQETQFKKAIASMKQSLPSSLQINGSNPLVLLHSALSKGVHDLDDAQCLELAKSARLVLIEFSNKLAQALKDDAELNEAVKKLSKT